MSQAKTNLDYKDLQDLIGSLSKNEKRYITLNASQQLRNGGSNFLALFKLIINNLELDTKELEKKIKGLKLKSLPETKHQLIQVIFKNLHNYYLESSIENSLHFYIHCIELAYQKSLISVASKFIQKAWERADSSETFTIQLQLIQWKAKLFKNNPNIQEQCYADEAEVLKKLNNINQYNQAKNILQKLIIKSGGRPKSQAEKDKIKSFYNKHVVLHSPDKALSFTALCQYHLINSAFSYTLGSSKEGLNHNKELLRILRKRPDIRTLSAGMYVANLQNAITFSNRLELYDQAHKYLEELKQFNSKNESINIQKNIFSSNMELTISLRINEQREAFKEITRFEETFNRYKDISHFTPEVYSLAYQIALISFFSGEYKHSLKWANIVLNAKIKIRHDITCAAQILFVLDHFELNNYDYLPNAIKSAKRSIKFKDGRTEIEMILLDGINKVIKEPYENHLSLFKEIKKSIKAAYEEDPSLYLPTLYFNFIKWLDLKIDPTQSEKK